MGSGLRSDIRLEEAGVDPVHCLIVVEAGLLSVRRWGASTFLNGEPFDEARLGIGDILSVGPIDMELVDPSGDHSNDPWVPRPKEEVHPSRNSENELSLPSSVSADQLLEAPCSEVTGPVLAQAPGEESLSGWPGPSNHVPTYVDETVREDSPQQPTLDQWNWLVHENARLSRDVEQLVDAQSHVISELSALASELTSLQNQWSEWWQSEVTQWQVQFAEHCQRVAALESQVAAVHQVMTAESERCAAAQTPADCNISTMPATETASDDSVPLEFRAPDARGADFGNLTGDASAPGDQSEGRCRSATNDDDSITYRREPSTSMQEVPDVALAGDYHSASEQVTGEGNCAIADGTQEVASEPSANPFSPPSYLESFADMFSDEVVGDDTCSKDREEPSGFDHPQQPSAEGHSRAAHISADASGDGEESIEAYMAKLLKRVGGTSARLPGTAEVASGINALTPLQWNEQPPVDTPASDVPHSEAGQTRSRSLPTESSTDIEAHRALANEAARQAIRVHSSQTYRRRTVTKFIVAMLAGTTSLWLMLDAPDARDLQFITACVTLMAASYWAGQTYSTLVESIRAQSYDGPQYDSFDDHPLHPALPIDLKRHRKERENKEIFPRPFADFLQ